MKKIYFTLGLSALLFGANAQQTLKIKNPLAKTNHSRIARGTNNSAATRNGGQNSVMQLTGGIISNNNYVAGTTMTLILTLNLTNTDQEYCDSLALTFPTGITPVTSTVNPDPFPGAQVSAGAVADPLNPIVGQTISWGENDNGQYGGISGGGPINFNVEVAITAGVVGTQTVNFFASGDGYGSTPGDMSGSFVLNPAVPNDLAAIASITTIGCSPTANSLVGFEFWNMGTTAASGFSVKYIVNGGTPVVETYTGTVNPNDTAVYFFTTPIAMVANTAYDVQVLTALTGDGYMTNDTTTTVGYTSDDAPYSTGFEPTPETDVVGWTPQQVTGSGNTWTIDNELPYLGTQEALLLSGVNGASDDWLFSPCLNLTAGKTYQVSYYAACFKTTGTGAIPGAGSIGISLGTKDSASYMTTTVKALKTLTTATLSASFATAYAADSATFTVPTTGTYVLGFEGKNTSATKQAFIALDNINIKDLGFTGIKTLTNNVDLSMYPNPTNSVLNIHTTAKAGTVEIYNVMGEVVMSKTLDNGLNTFDISNLSNGIYSVQVVQNNTVTIGKVIKTN